MIFVDNQNNTDAYINLAIEEHLLRHHCVDEEILLFYINSPSIIIGRNQNTMEEINLPYVEEHGIKVVRRLSGGGAVYHDLGNLNFSFINNNGRENIHNFKKFTAPVVKVLTEIGVPAELSGRNDILVDGRKISGNAQYISGQRMVSHGTLLFNSDLRVVTESLRVKEGKISSKGIKSIRSRVANISEFLPFAMNMSSFREQLKQGILAEEQSSEYQLSPTDWESIHCLVRDRYATWDWNFGRSPQYNIHKSEQFSIGEIDLRIHVLEGHIHAISFTGDFLGLRDISDIEDLLVGNLFTKSAISQALEAVDLQTYLGNIDKDEFIRFIYQ